MANTSEIKNATAPATYDGSVELYREAPVAVGVFVQVYNGAAYYELADDLRAWQAERYLGPFVGTIGEPTHGIRFRSADPANPAQVTAHLLSEGQTITGSVPNVDVAPSGTVTPIAGGGVGMFVGQIIEMGGLNPDVAKCLPCLGGAYLKTDYPDLNNYLQAAGYPWGSDATHFSVPDKRERVSIGSGNNNALGSNDGTAEANRVGTRHRHTPHAHGVNDPTHAHGPGGVAAGGWFETEFGVGTAGQGNGGGARNQGTVTLTDARATGITVANGQGGYNGTGGEPLDGPGFITTNFFIVFAT